MFGQFTGQEIKEGLIDPNLPDLPEIEFNNLWMGCEINAIWYITAKSLKASRTHVSPEDVLVPFLLNLYYLNQNPRGILVWSNEGGDQCASLGSELNSIEKVQWALQEYMETNEFYIEQDHSMPQGVWDIHVM